MTFASPPIYMEPWSRFPYCARVGDQQFLRASVPSEPDPSYVDWFRVSSHPYLLLGEGPSLVFGPADSRVEYVSVSIYLFSFMYLSYLNAVYYPADTFFLLQFANEWPSRVAPLLRLPPAVDMSPRRRQAVDLYIDDIRDLFSE